MPVLVVFAQGNKFQWFADSEQVRLAFACISLFANFSVCLAGCMGCSCSLCISNYFPNRCIVVPWVSLHGLPHDTQ